MANIGTFTAQNDSFTGTVRTLTLNVKVKIIPNAKEARTPRTTASSPATSRSARRGRNQQGRAALPVGDPG
jgi:uncharacterized protein (DUF736 family)